MWLIISLLILFPTSILALVRYNEVDAQFRPFFLYVLYLLCGGVFISLTHNTLLFLNAGVMFSYVLAATFFYMQGFFVNKKTTLWSMGGVLSIIWVFECIQKPSVLTFEGQDLMPYSQAALSLFIIICSIQNINRLLFDNERSLFQNSQLLIGLGFTSIYGVLSFVSISAIINNSLNIIHYNNFINIFIGANTISSILFGFAVLWIPKKKNFILPL